MSVGFGFSAGDFIATLSLVGTVIDALRSSGAAGAEYRELTSQLLSLETGLMQVKGLEFEESQYAEVIALRQAAAQCQRTIDSFLKRIEKYQPGLSDDREGVRGKWMRVRWAVCKREDVVRFKADLVGHTESIQVLLMAIQMGSTMICEKKQNERHRSLVGMIQDGFFGCMQRLATVAEQGKQLLELTTAVFQTNVKVFQIVLEIQQSISHIPGQIDRQQPGYMIDALGKQSPFHLEFVRSAEALVAVLKINFQEHLNGPEKIERGEFAIQDATTRKEIDLTGNWESCFLPGQRVEMCMVYLIQEERSASKVERCKMCEPHSPCNLRWMKSISDGNTGEVTTPARVRTRKGIRMPQNHSPISTDSFISVEGDLGENIEHIEPEERTQTNSQLYSRIESTDLADSNFTPLDAKLPGMSARKNAVGRFCFPLNTPIYPALTEKTTGRLVSEPRLRRKLCQLSPPADPGI